MLLMDDTQAYRGNPISAQGVGGNGPWKNSWFEARTLRWPSSGLESGDFHRIKKVTYQGTIIRDDVTK